MGRKAADSDSPEGGTHPWKAEEFNNGSLEGNSIFIDINS